jgi:hypothetical protein
MFPIASSFSFCFRQSFHVISTTKKSTHRQGANLADPSLLHVHQPWAYNMTKIHKDPQSQGQSAIKCLMQIFEANI